MRSGNTGPWDAPDLGAEPRRREPRWRRAVGHRQLPDLPQPRGPRLRARLVPQLPVLADVAQHARLRGRPLVRPGHDRPRAPRPRVRGDHRQGVRAPGRRARSTAPSSGSSPGRSPSFPLNDQEILVRHFHKTVGDWVARRAPAMTGDAVAPARVRRPRAVRGDVVPADRARALGASPRQHDGRDAGVLRRLLPAGRRTPSSTATGSTLARPARRRRSGCCSSCCSLALVSYPIEVWRQPLPVDIGSARIDRIDEPRP